MRVVFAMAVTAAVTLAAIAYFVRDNNKEILVTGVGCKLTRALDQDFGANIAFEPGQLEFESGEPIALNLLVTNCTDSKKTRRYRDARRYEFSVESVKSTYEEVWRWPEQEAFPQMVGEETYQPGETRRYRVVWDQTNQKGEQVEPGLYDVSADDLRCEFDAPATCTHGTSIVIRISD